MGAQCRNILPSLFSVLTDQKVEKAESNIFVYRPSNSVNKGFIALPINPKNFLEKVDA